MSLSSDESQGRWPTGSRAREEWGKRTVIDLQSARQYLNLMRAMDLYLKYF